MVRIHYLSVLTVLLVSFGCHSPKSLPREEQKKELETSTQRQLEVIDQNAPTNGIQKKQMERDYSVLDLELKRLEVRIAGLTGKERVALETELDELKKRRSELQIDFDQAKYDELLKDLKNSAQKNLHHE